MSEVVDFTGITKGRVSPDKVLRGAEGLDDILIIGWKGNEFYMAASNGHIGETLILLELAKQTLMEEFG